MADFYKTFPANLISVYFFVERDEAIKRCEEYVEIKENIEGHLYSQFAEAFNTLKIKMNVIKGSITLYV